MKGASIGYIDESYGLRPAAVSDTQERLMRLLDGSAQLDGLEETSAKHVYSGAKTLIGNLVYWDRLFYTDLNPFCLADFGLKLADAGLTFEGDEEPEFESPLGKGEFKEHLEEQARRINSAAEKGRWEYVFETIDKRIAISLYIYCFELIPDKKKWDAFIAMYTRCELGFEALEPMYSEIFSYAGLSRKRAGRLRRLAKKVGKEFTVYHGAKDDDSKWNPHDVYSWTLSENTAWFFAHRFNKDGEVWERKISIEDAVDYLTDRNEEEVLLDYAALPKGDETRTRK